MERYIALLRGINVGGKNVIKMTDLKSCFETMGFENVVTFIQSGNVVFDSKETDLDKLCLKIEKNLSSTFNYVSKIVLIIQDTLKQIVANAPDGFGSDSENYRYDFFFLKPPLDAAETLLKIKKKEGVDFVFAGNGVLYFSRLSEKSSQSEMTKIIGTPIYKEMTIRNWNTTTKLCTL